MSFVNIVSEFHIIKLETKELRYSYNLSTIDLRSVSKNYRKTYYFIHIAMISNIK